MIESILKKLNWSDKEIHVYMGLLKNGPSSVRGLAEQTGINRGTTYDILKSLRDRGIVSFFQKTSKQLFVAEDPTRLLNELELQTRLLKRTKDELTDAIPQLRSLYDRGDSKPVSRMYEGINGIKQILEDILETTLQTDQRKYYIYSAANARSFVYQAMPNFTEQRIAYQITVQAISLQQGGETHGLDERRFIALEDAPTETYMFIYAGKIAYISSDEAGNPVGTIIENKSIYEIHHHIFEALWKKLAT